MDAALDFVGVTPTIKAARACTAQGGRLTVVGIAGGLVEWSFFDTPYESTITNTYWGTIEDLYEVVDMYRAGQITPDIERFSNGPEPRRQRAGAVNAESDVTARSR